MVRPRQGPRISSFGKLSDLLGAIMGNDFPGGWHRVLRLSAAAVCSNSPAVTGQSPCGTMAETIRPAAAPP